MMAGSKSSAETAKSDSSLPVKMAETQRLRHSSFDLGVVTSTRFNSSLLARGKTELKEMRIPRFDGSSFKIEA